MSDFSINFVQFTVKEENKKSDKSPDVTGNIEAPAEEVNALISYLQNAERVLDWQDKEVDAEVRHGLVKELGDDGLKGRVDYAVMALLCVVLELCRQLPVKAHLKVA